MIEYNWATFTSTDSGRRTEQEHLGNIMTQVQISPVTADIYLPAVHKTNTISHDAVKGISPVTADIYLTAVHKTNTI